MISIITPIAYDYKYAFNSIACYYNIADEIILGLDRDRISWSNNLYKFDDNKFFDTIHKLDTENKISVIQDNFHLYESPIHNDTYERNFLSNSCKQGNWIIQIDSDEYLLNPKEFATWLNNTDTNFDIHAEWITVYKVIGDHCLIINEPNNSIPIGTMTRNSYVSCRDTQKRNLKSNAKLLHYSWGRSRDELLVKLKNWGHSKDFDTQKYLDIWDLINLENYTQLKNFHPLYGPYWRNLQALHLKL